MRPAQRHRPTLLPSVDQRFEHKEDAMSLLENLGSIVDQFSRGNASEADRPRDL
jgi:hypothetical protein